MKFIYRMIVLLLAVSQMAGTAHAASAPTGAFILSFESQTLSVGSEASLGARVAASFLVNPVPDQLGLYRGMGRLRYTQLSGFAGGGVDGILAVYEMRISSDDGTVTLTLFPGDPKPTEWVIFPNVPPLPFFQWFGVFGFFHTSELGVGGFTITNWEYPGGDVYARKSYSNSQSEGDVSNQETTVIELIPVVDPPRIDSLLIESEGLSPDDPQTGKKVTLSADLFTPFPFEIERCTWTGNNFTGQGVGDPDNNCQWDYTPVKGEGPRRDTYGDKQTMLTAVYRFGATPAAVRLSESKDYKVFFEKKGDDNSDGDPNWFDYWGDDEAVPGLDDSDVGYDGSMSAIGEYRGGSQVFLGPGAGDADGELSITATPLCAGGLFPGAQGIDLAAITLAHERKHKELGQIGGTDTDGDGVPDSQEGATDPNDADSCNMAAQVHPDYATYGDDEYTARLAELGVNGVDDNDWAVPGRQAVLSKKLASTQVLTHSFGVVDAGRPQLFNSAHRPAKGLDGSLIGNYNAVGEDVDFSGLFDALVLEVDVSVVEANRYSVVAWLADPDTQELVWARSAAVLDAGTHTMTLRFPGAVLNRSGALNSFVVSRIELDATVGKHSVTQDSGADVYATPFVASDFDPPAALLVGAGSEIAIDDDMNGQFERLDIPIDLVINEPGQYQISAVLAGDHLLLRSAVDVALNKGAVNTQAVLSFDGEALFYFRENGPFELKALTLTEAAQGDQLDYQATALTTGALAFADFAQSGITINEGSYTDAGGVMDSQGRLETLDLALTLQFDFSLLGSPALASPGHYFVHTNLEDNSGQVIATASADVLLGLVEANDQTGRVELVETTPVALGFAGSDIAASGIDGPYQVASVTVISDEGLVMDHNPRPYATAFYSADSFSVAQDLIMESNFEVPAR